jgi:hypothetical protein
MKEAVKTGLKDTATKLREIADLLENDNLVLGDLPILTGGLEDARKAIDIYALIEATK